MAESAENNKMRTWRVAMTLAAAFLVICGAALAATVTRAPSVSGTPKPGADLTASTGEWSPSSATPNYDWLRCDSAGNGCSRVPGACERKYTVRDADVGHTLRARLTVTEADQPPSSAVSAPTSKVFNTPYTESTGPDSGNGCVLVMPTGPGKGTFTSGGATGKGTTPAPDTKLEFIDPFPVVRMAGRFKGKRTKLTKVTVNAPAGVRIQVNCKGRGCPFKRKALATKLTRIKSLQRSYAPKATIEIRVTQPQKIGKYTRLKTRKGGAPLRIDRCLMPGHSKPVRCPSA
jgi:hypothetical protein